MIRTLSVCCLGLLLLGIAGCSEDDRTAVEADYCSSADSYELAGISGVDQKGNWFQYADSTPGGYPDVLTDGSTISYATEPPERCDDTEMFEFKAYGHNFYGVGFGTWNLYTSAADGSDYEGIAFWAKSASNTDKTFMFYVDDGRTVLAEVGKPNLDSDGDGTFDAVKLGEYDTDVDGDGILDAGDILANTACRIPPSNISDCPCYGGGSLPPSNASRVPAVNECGNAFHTWITTTTEWQLITIPWSDLVQWPCPNRVEGGINPADIRMVELKFLQGTNYDVWIDNISFYRRR